MIAHYVYIDRLQDKVVYVSPAVMEEVRAFEVCTGITLGSNLRIVSSWDCAMAEANCRVVAVHRR